MEPRVLPFKIFPLKGINQFMSFFISNTFPILPSGYFLGTHPAHREKMRWAILENKMFTLLGVSFLKCLLRKFSKAFTYNTRENLWCVEGTLHPSISLLEIGRDIRPTPQGWEGNYALLLLKSRHKELPIHTPNDIGLVHELF